MRHLLRRVIFYLCAIWVAVTLDFFIPRLAPGDPVAAMVGKMSTKGYVTPAMSRRWQPCLVSIPMIPLAAISEISE